MGNWGSWATCGSCLCSQSPASARPQAGGPAFTAPDGQRPTDTQSSGSRHRHRPAGWGREPSYVSTLRERAGLCSGLASVEQALLDFFVIPAVSSPSQLAYRMIKYICTHTHTHTRKPSYLCQKKPGETLPAVPLPARFPSARGAQKLASSSTQERLLRTVCSGLIPSAYFLLRQERKRTHRSSAAWGQEPGVPPAASLDGALPGCPSAPLPPLTSARLRSAPRAESDHRRCRPPAPRAHAHRLQERGTRSSPAPAARRPQPAPIVRPPPRPVPPRRTGGRRREEEEEERRTGPGRPRVGDAVRGPCRGGA